jgi:hypothetical protein
MNHGQGFGKTLKTKAVVGSFFIFFLLFTMGCGTLSQMQQGAGESEAFLRSVPSVTVTPTVAEYKAGVHVLISGSGFEPKQKLKLFIAMGGVSSGIHFLVKPEPLTNDLGAFASVWSIGREISSKLIEPLPTVYTLSVEDKDGKTLCTAPLLFCDPKAKEKPPECQFLK